MDNSKELESDREYETMIRTILEDTLEEKINNDLNIKLYNILQMHEYTNQKKYYCPKKDCDDFPDKRMVDIEIQVSDEYDANEISASNEKVTIKMQLDGSFRGIRQIISH